MCLNYAGLIRVGGGFKDSALAPDPAKADAPQKEKAREAAASKSTRTVKVRERERAGTSAALPAPSTMTRLSWLPDNASALLSSEAMTLLAAHADAKCDSDSASEALDVQVDLQTSPLKQLCDRLRLRHDPHAKTLLSNNTRILQAIEAAALIDLLEQRSDPASSAPSAPAAAVPDGRQGRGKAAVTRAGPLQPQGQGSRLFARLYGADT